MFWDILDQKRKEVLPRFQRLQEYGFYLSGGTALALILGHRDSIDFDFFSQKDFDNQKLFNDLKEIFAGFKLQQVQSEKGTVTIFLDDEIKISFFVFKYPLIEEEIKTDYFKMASLVDIACMKANAIINRSTLKDYVDFYFILQEISLNEIVDALSKKMPDIDILLFLKSLIYFEDIDKNEPIMFKKKTVVFSEISSFLIEKVKEYQINILK